MQHQFSGVWRIRPGGSSYASNSRKNNLLWKRRTFLWDRRKSSVILGDFGLLALLCGQLTIPESITGDKVKISLVQGNIEQPRKWDPKYAQEILQIYGELTQEAAKDQPALIIWPETATPEAITRNPRVYLEVINIAKKAGTNLLLGSAQHQKFESKGTRKLKLSNSAYLLNPIPEIPEIRRYDKVRLFPFGEYLPYKETLPWFLIKVEDSYSYAPGKEFTVLNSTSVSVTICWENVSLTCLENL
jgi:apolipoprotein N-acyltransferase